MTEKIKCGNGFIEIGEPCPPIPSIMFFEKIDLENKTEESEKGKDDKASQSS
jgi:hypothetical protein